MKPKLRLQNGMQLAIPLNDNKYCRGLIIRCSRGGNSALGVFFDGRFINIACDDFANLTESDAIVAFCFGRQALISSNWKLLGIDDNFNISAWKKPLLFSRSPMGDMVNSISVSDTNVLKHDEWNIVRMSEDEFETVKHFQAGAAGYIYIEEYLSMIVTCK